MNAFIIAAVLIIGAQAFSEQRAEYHNISLDELVYKERIVPIIEGAPKYDGRIINGINATRGQFPHMVALILDASSSCGGSLISPRMVLTAAHCAFGISSFTVFLGAHDLVNLFETGRITVMTSRKIIHSGYDSQTLGNDIALIDLQNNVVLSDFIKVVGIASGNALFVDKSARASGWGMTSDSDPLSRILMFVDLKVISNDECKKGFGNLIKTSNICTQGSGTSGVCQGDSGSALLDLDSGKQIGIVSFTSASSCESEYPNVFVRVSSFSEWISLNTGIDI